MNDWPKQKDCDTFYGNPRGKDGHASVTWEATKLVRITPPFRMTYAGKPIKTVTIHRKCADSLGRVFLAIWIAAGKDQTVIDRWFVSIFGGSYNYRLKRNSNTLSMHAYGCAIDLAPEKYPMGTSKAHFADPVLKAFKDEGWVNLPKDLMHFQCAIV